MGSSYKEMRASLVWSLDKMIKEISKPEYNVEIKLSVEMPRDNELHFIITTRDTMRDTEILKDLARSFYGYTQKK